MTSQPNGQAHHQPRHWFESLADYMGDAYLKYSFTKGTANEVDFLISQLGLTATTRVLDVGCGPGRHALELARRGIPVLGVDVSATFIDLASQAAAAKQLDHLAQFTHGDAADGAWDGEFGAVISLCQGAFGLSGGPGTAASGPVELEEPILRVMANALQPGGRLAVSAFSAYFQVQHLEEHDRFDAWHGVNHEHTSLLDVNRSSQEAELWTTCFTPRELRLLARSVGLTADAVYSVTPGRYGPSAPTIDLPEFLLIAHKAGAGVRG